MTIKILQGDCLSVMPTLDAGSIDAVVTDPPYGLSFMGKGWDHGVPGVPYWTEVFRVLKPGAHLVAFGGTRTYHRMVCAIEDAGFGIRDQLAWLYSNGFPKSHNLGNGFGTALKPAWEPVVLARKPLSENTVTANMRRWHTGALNIEGTKIHADDVVGPRHRHGGGVKGAGTSYEMPDSKGNQTPGRWPANLIHDGSEEVLTHFPESAGQLVTSRSDATTKTNTIYGKMLHDPVPHKPRGDKGSAARFFYAAKASKHDRAGSKHPTVKPVNLIAYLCRLVTPPGGTVLDPFAGSGTCATACVREGFDCVLIEREAEYVADIERRVAALAAAGCVDPVPQTTQWTDPRMMDDDPGPPQDSDSTSK